MPWCATCDRYLTPPAVRPDGTCPSCGRAVEVAGRVNVPAGRSTAAEPNDATRGLPPIPWHFKLLCGAVAVYLGYRFAQMGEWLLHRL